MKDERMIRAFASIGPGAEDRERMRKRLQQSLSAPDGREREQHRRPSPGMKKRTVVVLAAALVLLLSATTLAATGFLEVTNGVALLSTSACTRQIKSLLAVLFLSWGGLSGIFQVSSILHQTGLSLRNYVLQKIILLLLTVGCCIPLLFLGILI